MRKGLGMGPHSCLEGTKMLGEFIDTTRRHFSTGPARREVEGLAGRPRGPSLSPRYCVLASCVVFLSAVLSIDFAGCQGLGSVPNVLEKMNLCLVEGRLVRGRA